ncbi:MAG: hypothetical protein D6760_03520 [Deltaproteobacteria bacterium]|nr:MAG: hypothetical protein D6760_03520 [Deltaproteobacteria bacterium]
MKLAIRSALVQSVRPLPRSRLPIVLVLLVLAGIARPPDAAGAAPGAPALVRSCLPADLSSCASTTGVFGGTWPAFEEADGRLVRDVVLAAIERNPKRKVDRWSSLTWLPDVAERLELLEEHSRRAAERRAGELDRNEAAAGGLPRPQRLESKEQQQ